jgi:hypothetical protein
VTGRICEDIVSVRIPNEVEACYDFLINGTVGEFVRITESKMLGNG